MIVLGLTGSIAMGKSTAAHMLAEMGLPVHDADATVHALLGPGGAAVPAIARAFPGVVENGAVDRPRLGGQVFGRPAALKRLEAIVHPLVRAEERRFLTHHRRRRTPLVVLNVPLLLESPRARRRCDHIAVVSAPVFLQRRRALARPGMTPQRLNGILRRQMPDAAKRRLADSVIPATSRVATRRALRRLLGEIGGR
ncbi:dephospho-CoA kinase [Roseospirillum parvum]|uniref:Dephospho-CoA kinase n=1 Tax=Roseospirillum parvum TaxID=83401 RepID=A0A1G7Z8Z0_9PROT|nr:dephospho-CoA kinase [Roseospirillum parvum]SDH05164.1 dephospho-CoA kinase [Roseospirillum parvum]